MKKISIIIPIYNKEKYLEKCLNSVIKQTYKNLEIILINDGSTDNSLNICKKFKKMDHRIIIINQKNMGVSASRNVGIKQAHGEKLFFIDADDFINEVYVESFTKYHEDLVVGSYYNILKNKIIYKEKTKNICCTDRKTILRVCLDPNNCNKIIVPYIKMFDRKIIVENKIFFNENISFGEDSCFVFDYIKYIKSVRFINFYGYYNVIVNGTLSRKYVENINKSIEIFNDKIFSFKEEVNKNILSFWIFRNYKLILYNEKEKNYSHFRDVLNNINKNRYFKFLTSNNFYFKDKILYKLIKFKIYILIYIIYNLKK